MTADAPVRNREEQFYRVSGGLPWTELAALSQAVVTVDVANPVVEVTHDSGVHFRFASARDGRLRALFIAR